MPPISRAKLKGRCFPAPSVVIVVSTTLPPNFAVRCRVPFAREVNFPVVSISPLAGSETESVAVDVMSRSTPSAPVASTRKRCEAGFCWANAAHESTSKDSTVRRNRFAILLFLLGLWIHHHERDIANQQARSRYSVYHWPAIQLYRR